MIRGKTRGAERPAELIDHIAKRDRLRLHQVPCHGVCGGIIDVAGGEPGNGVRDIFDRHRLERRRRFVGRQLQRERRQRAQQRAAAIGRGRHDKARPQDRVGDARGGDQPLGVALGGAEGGAVLISRAGNGDMDEAYRAAAVADRGERPFDEIAMHGAGVAARTVLQHAEAIDDDIDFTLADQPRQRGDIHRHDR